MTTIEEIKKARTEAEVAISKILLQLQRDTECEVTYLSIDVTNSVMTTKISLEIK